MLAKDELIQDLGLIKCPWGQEKVEESQLEYRDKGDRDGTNKHSKVEQ